MIWSRFRVRTETVGRSGVTPEARREPSLKKQGPSASLDVTNLSLRYGIGLADARCCRCVVPTEVFYILLELPRAIAPNALDRSMWSGEVVRDS